MNSKEIVKRTIDFQKPERIGWSFIKPYDNDFYDVSTPLKDSQWGREPLYATEVPWFTGEIKKDPFGNVWGRLDNTARGECIKGVLQEGWGGLADYSFPEIEMQWFETLRNVIAGHSDKYIVGALPGMPFSIMRTIRGMENFLMDVMLEEEKVVELGEKSVSFLERIIKGYGVVGVDAVMFWEDWGTQNALLVSPKVWRRIFKPWFERITTVAHQYNMHVIMHSCGYIYEIMEDLIDTGIDVFQLDQPTLIGLQRLNNEFGGRVTFYSPVDIQKVMQTGDKKVIQSEAKNMIKLLGGYNGGFIAKDYSLWEDIQVKEEWAAWARDVFLNEGWY